MTTYNIDQHSLAVPSAKAAPTPKHINSQSPFTVKSQQCRHCLPRLGLAATPLKPQGTNQALAPCCTCSAAGDAPAAAAVAGVEAAAVPATLAARRLQTGLCCFQCAAWHGRPQYLCHVCSDSRWQYECVHEAERRVSVGMWHQVSLQIQHMTDQRQPEYLWTFCAHCVPAPRSGLNPHCSWHP
jgi:hypothetical protein